LRSENFVCSIGEKRHTTIRVINCFSEKNWNICWNYSPRLCPHSVGCNVSSV